MDKQFFYEKEIRAELATFNPYLKKDIEQVRAALNISKDGFSTAVDATKWYDEHYQTVKGKHPQGAPLWNWHLPKELVEMIDSRSFSEKPSRAGFDSEIPLDNYAMEIVHKFGLPEEMVNSVKSFILKEEHNAMNIPSELQKMFLPIDEGEEGIKYIAIVAGLDEGTTKNQWDQIWQNFQVIMKLHDKKKAPNRRPMDKLMLRNLTLWSWVKKDGKTVKETLDTWLKKHPDDVDKLNIDTVQKAIQKIDNLMKPIGKHQT